MLLEDILKKTMSTNVFISVFVIQVLSLSYLSATEDVRKISQAIRDLKSYKDASREINSLKRTVRSIDDDLAAKQKRTCQVGINSHHCSLADIDNLLQSSEWLKSGYSPGKRSNTDASNQEPDEETQRLLEDLARKRRDLLSLRSLLDDADNDIMQQRKRTCLVELGGACRTEWASAIADQYYYLMGPYSPGRKKRSPINLYKRRLSLLKNKHQSLKQH